MREKELDIVIVGSGAGGGTVAEELSPLCREGARIAMLEWGPKLREEEYTGRELEMSRRLYVDGGGFLTADRSITLALGKAYGGSTVVYTGTSLPPPEAVIAKWNVPGLTYADVRMRSDKHARANNVHLLPEPLINDNNRLFREGCARLGYRVAQFPINVRGCRGSGMCNLGCPNQAKLGTHRVQLPAAERNGVTVVTNCRVDRIEERSCIATVGTLPYGEASAWEPGTYRVKAKAIVLSAGAVGTPALLLRSHLPVSLPALGRYFTCHPAIILVGQHERPITNCHGHPKSYYSDEFAATGRYLLETCMYFPFVTAKSLSGFGAPHSMMMGHMDRLQMILVLALDPALPDNRVAVDRNGDPEVHYRLAPEVREALLDSMKTSARIFFAGGCARVHAPAGRKPVIEASEQDRLDDLIGMDRCKPGMVSVSAAHVMGGCRMGRDASDSVTDALGQVHGVPWLYVADASLFPSSVEVNPYLTVMALADRAAEAVRSRGKELFA